MVAHEIITRGNLPHWYVPGAAHFVTYRLAGTIPIHVLETLAARKNEILSKPLPEGMSEVQRRHRVHKQFFAQYDRHLDANRAVDWLARPDIATMVRSNLYYHNTKKYHLLAYCVLPNHVHVLLQPLVEAARFVTSGEESFLVKGFVYGDEEPCGEVADSRSPLTAIMHSLKSYTAHEANKLLGRSGQFWQHESYDHWVRDDDELERIVEYIVWNPVKAGLVREPREWPCCSARDRYQRDGV
jgi:putative DNA methylase